MSKRFKIGSRTYENIGGEIAFFPDKSDNFQCDFEFGRLFQITLKTSDVYLSRRLSPILVIKYMVRLFSRQLFTRNSPKENYVRYVDSECTKIIISNVL